MCSWQCVIDGAVKKFIYKSFLAVYIQDQHLEAIVHCWSGVLQFWTGKAIHHRDGFNREHALSLKKYMNQLFKISSYIEFFKSHVFETILLDAFAGADVALYFERNNSQGIVQVYADQQEVEMTDVDMQRLKFLVNVTGFMAVSPNASIISRYEDGSSEDITSSLFLFSFGDLGTSRKSFTTFFCHPCHHQYTHCIETVINCITLIHSNQ